MDEDKNRMKCMQQQSHVFRLSIETMEPPMTDPPVVLQRDDGVSAALRMVSAAQTSTLVLTGEAGVGKSMLAALVYRRLEAVAQAGQALIRHFAWLSLGPNATLPEVIAAIVGSIDVGGDEGVRTNGIIGAGGMGVSRAGVNREGGNGMGVGSRAGVSDRAGASSLNEINDRAGASPAPTRYGRFPDIFIRAAHQQLE